MSVFIKVFSFIQGMKYIRHVNFIHKTGERLRTIRELKKISQQELSYKTEISKNQIGRIERGEINFGISTLYELCKALEITLSDFFKGLD